MLPAPQQRDEEEADFAADHFWDEFLRFRFRGSYNRGIEGHMDLRLDLGLLMGLTGAVFYMVYARKRGFGLLRKARPTRRVESTRNDAAVVPTESCDSP